MNKSISILLVVVAVLAAVASATVSGSVGYRSGPYYSYQPYPYQAGYYGPSYGPGYYRGYSAQMGVAPAYSSYQPYYSSYQPYYSNYYGPSYYPYASSRA